MNINDNIVLERIDYGLIIILLVHVFFYISVNQCDTVTLNVLVMNHWLIYTSTCRYLFKLEVSSKSFERSLNYGPAKIVT